jgi:hypothetical protein
MHVLWALRPNFVQCNRFRQPPLFRAAEKRQRRKMSQPRRRACQQRSATLIMAIRPGSPQHRQRSARGLILAAPGASFRELTGKYRPLRSGLSTHGRLGGRRSDLDPEINREIQASRSGAFAAASAIAPSELTGKYRWSCSGTSPPAGGSVAGLAVASSELTGKYRLSRLLPSRASAAF